MIPMDDLKEKGNEKVEYYLKDVGEFWSPFLSVESLGFGEARLNTHVSNIPHSER